MSTAEMTECAPPFWKKDQYRHKGCYFFRITYFLIRICQIADRDQDMQTRKPRSRLTNLIRQFIDSQNTIEKRLRAKLQNSNHELGVFIRVKSGNQLITTRLPFITSVKSELEAPPHTHSK